MTRTLSFLSAAAVLAAAAPAMADETYICTSGGTERQVQVVSLENADRVCEVRYRKPTEGVPETVLWYAEHQPDYCRDQAAAFAEKLAGFGWECAIADPAADFQAAAPSMPGDERDPDALDQSLDG